MVAITFSLTPNRIDRKSAITARLSAEKFIGEIEISSDSTKFSCEVTYRNLFIKLATSNAILDLDSLANCDIGNETAKITVPATSIANEESDSKSKMKKDSARLGSKLIGIGLEDAQTEVYGSKNTAEKVVNAGVEVNRSSHSIIVNKSSATNPEWRVCNNLPYPLEYLALPVTNFSLATINRIDGDDCRVSGEVHVRDEDFTIRFEPIKLGRRLELIHKTREYQWALTAAYIQDHLRRKFRKKISETCCPQLRIPHEPTQEKKRKRKKGKKK